MYTEQLHDKIDAYLTGKLSADERASFEQMIREDPGVKVYLEAHKTADAALALSIEHDLRKKLSRIDEDLDRIRDQQGTGKKRNKGYQIWRFAAVAASLFIALALVIHFWTMSQVAPEMLATKNLVILDDQTRGEQTADSPFQLMENAATAFRANKYANAIALYQAVMEGDNLLYEPAEFNLALAFLAKGDASEASNRLEAIARNSDHQYQQEAIRILKKLEKQR